MFRATAPSAALIVDPGDEAERILAAVDELGLDGRGDPAHPHPLRPHRRGRAGRGGDRSAGLVPGDRGAGARRHHGLRPLAGVRPVRELRADETAHGGEKLELAGLEIDVIFTPGHSPGHVTYSIPDEQALFSGDVLFQGSVGPRRPARRRRADPAGVDPQAGRGASPRRPPSTPATWGSRRSAPSAPRTRSWPSSPAPLTGPRRLSARCREVQGPARDLRRPARAAGGGGAIAERPARCSERAGYGRIETPGLRGHRAVRARGRGVHRHRPQGDVHFEDQGGRSLTLRPEGTAPICRAYLEHGMHKLAQPVKLWYGARSSATSARRPGASASSTRSAPRRSAPTRRWSTPS